MSALEGRSFPGKAAPTESVVLSFRVSGPLVERPADVGSQLKKGELIARIDPRDFEVALAEVRARLDRAKADLQRLLAGEREERIRALENKVRANKAEYEQATIDERRNKGLLDKGTIPQAEYDRYKLRLDVALERYEAAKEELEAAQVARPERIDAKRAEIRSLEAAVSRLRPVLLAAGTTVLGVVPLLPDIFWVSMAVAIMCGLTLGTLITMVFVPVLYTMFYRVSPQKKTVPMPAPQSSD